MSDTATPTNAPRKRKAPEPARIYHLNKPGTGAVVRAAMRVKSWMDAERAAAEARDQEVA